MREGVKRWRELGLDGRSPYFNGGMLVVDRLAWRAEDIERRVVDYLERFRDEVVLLEQEAFNATLDGDWKRLHTRWNYMTTLEGLMKVRLAHIYSFVDADEIDEARTNPAIVHYASPAKPWIRGTETPFREEWWEVVADSPWASQPPDHPRRHVVRESRRRVRQALRTLVRGI
jgi:lipopolysaccharide biosynthesis glycosyltransferase